MSSIINPCTESIAQQQKKKKKPTIVHDFHSTWGLWRHLYVMGRLSSTGRSGSRRRQLVPIGNEFCIFTASRHHQTASQHSHIVVCQRDGAVNLTEVMSLKSYRRADLLSAPIRHLNLHLVSFCVKWAVCYLSLSLFLFLLCLPIKSLSLQLNHAATSKECASDRRCWRIKATAG